MKKLTKIFAVLCVISGCHLVFADHTADYTYKSPKTGNVAIVYERSPRETAKSALNSLTGDTIQRMSEYEDSIAKECAKLDDDTIVAKDVTVYVKTIDTHNISGRLHTDFNAAETHNVKVEIPIEKINNTPQGRNINKLTAVVAVWKNQHKLTKIGSKNQFLPYNGSAITVTYFRATASNTGAKESLPITYTMDLENDLTEIDQLKSNERLNHVDRVCAWLDLTSGTWNRSGCTTTISNARTVSCECDHTTTFVTLLIIDKDVAIPDEIYSISLAFEIASVCCLFLTIVFICVARQGTGIDSSFAAKATGMSANRTNSQVSLCVSLLLLHLVIVWSDIARNNDNACLATSAMTHYFLLASAIWSLCEGVGIFIKMFPGMTLNVEYRTMTIAQTAVAWIVPLIITVSCVIYGIVHEGTYMDISNAYKQMLNKTSHNDSTAHTPKYDKCWLSGESGMIWAALVPLIFVIAVNIVIIIYVTTSVVKMNRNTQTYQIRDYEESGFGNRLTVNGNGRANEGRPSAASDASRGSAMSTDILLAHNKHVKHMISVTRSFAILMPILAVPWIFAILGNIPHTDSVFLTVHTIINGLQGLQIFLLYCVVNKKDWRIVKRKWKNSGLKFLISHYRHRRDSVMTHSSRVVSYGVKGNVGKTDANANAYVSVAWKNGGPLSQYDTLSSCKSSEGTMNSSQSLQRGATPSPKTKKKIPSRL